MKSHTLRAVSMAILMVSSGCATIFSASIYPVLVDSNPKNARFEILDRYQNRIYSGITPERVYLPASYYPFIRQRYTILVNDPDFESTQMPITFHIDGWYFVNLLIPPLAPFTMLIVDPLSGSMFTMDYHCRRPSFNLRRINSTSIEDTSQNMPESQSNP